MTYAKQAKSTASYSSQALPGFGPGTVFYGWLFLFTVPTWVSGFSKVAKSETTFTKVAKP